MTKVFGWFLIVLGIALAVPAILSGGALGLPWAFLALLVFSGSGVFVLYRAYGRRQNKAGLPEQVADWEIQAESEPAISSERGDELMSTDTAYLATHTLIGEEAATGDDVDIADVDRYSGMYILGKQGTGKSSLLQLLIYQDIANKDTAVIVIDPHGDLVEHVIAQIPEKRLKDTYLLDMEDEAYPFGVNVFPPQKPTTSIATTQAVDRVMHVFETRWGETLLSQRDLPRYLRLATLVLLASPGTTLVDMYYFLREDNERLRQRMLKNVSDSDIKSFWNRYADKSQSAQKREIDPLLYRLEALFLGRGIVKNIVGQSQTSIDFRRSIENREIILIKLPLKTLPQDAELIGTMLIAQIHAALFSFANLPQERRPGFSLFVDEFEHFATTDFAEMFSEGRKFGVRLALAHQTRTQIPDGLKVLKSTTMNATTLVCFATNDDASVMADKFPGKAEIDMNTIPGDVVSYLIRNGHPHPDVSECATSLLPFMRKHATEDGNLQGLTALNALLIDCMREGNANRDIPESIITLLFQSGYNPRIFEGVTILHEFFHEEYSYINFNNPKPLFYLLCKPNVFRYEEQLKAQVSTGVLTASDIKQKRRKAVDNILGWISVLRATMEELAAHPLADTVAPSNSQVASQISILPKWQAMVKTSTSTYHIKTFNPNPNNPNRNDRIIIPTVSPPQQQARKRAILAQTHKKYCKPSTEVESEIMQRLGALQQETAPTIERPSKPEQEAAPEKPWSPFEDE